MTFSQQWNKLLTAIPKRRNYTQKIVNFQNEVEVFNQGLRAKLTELESEISSLIRYFGYPLNIKFEFNGIQFDETARYSSSAPESSLSGREILLNVDFLEKNIISPHLFLNEAKLSAIAIAIYLSSLLVAPKPKLKLLILDDVFIGLDMSNRLPLIDILKEKFEDYQIFLMTYDKEWYEILKGHFSDWKMIEIYAGHLGDFEIPVLVENKKYLEKAKSHFQNHDYKASAVYLRTAFESIIKQFCEEKNILIEYREKPQKLKADDFWKRIKRYVDAGLVQEIEQYRSLIMNPLTHAQLINPYRQAIQKAIDTVERLEQTLEAIVNPPSTT